MSLALFGDDPSDKSLVATTPPLTRRTGECGIFALFTKPPLTQQIYRK